jgi:hypothetical protein
MVIGIKEPSDYHSQSTKVSEYLVMSIEHSFGKGILALETPEDSENCNVFCRIVHFMICGNRMIPIIFWHNDENRLDRTISTLTPVIRQALMALEVGVLWPFFETYGMFPDITFIHNYNLAKIPPFDPQISTFITASSIHIVLLCQDDLKPDERERAMNANPHLIILRDGLDHIPRQITEAVCVRLQIQPKRDGWVGGVPGPKTRFVLKPEKPTDAQVKEHLKPEHQTTEKSRKFAYIPPCFDSGLPKPEGWRS